MSKIRTSAFCIAATIAGSLAAGPWSASAAPAQAFDKSWNLCAAQTAGRERSEHVPTHLLTAVSLAESGRWNPGRKENVAWPWTVTAEGKGKFFPDKDAAADYVRRLKARGIRNIDVGCMQVNLHYHGKAFASIEQALDPVSNVAYGSRYLKTMFRSTQSWLQAAGYYHSMTPKRSRSYMLKVLELWNRELGKPTRVPSPSVAPPPPPPPIDLLRTAQLNARLRLARAASRPAEGAEARATLRRGQLDGWRQARQDGLSSAHIAVMRRAELETQRRLRRLGTGATGSGDGFAARRQQQLKAWRLSRAGS